MPIASGSNANAPAKFVRLFKDENLWVRPYAPGGQSRKAYHPLIATCKNRVAQTFGSVLPPLNGGIILDAGCSMGLTTCELADLYPHCKVVGIDVKEDVLGWARFHGKDKLEAGQIAFLQADGYQLGRSFSYSVRFSAIFFMNNLLYRVRHLQGPEIKDILDQTRPFLQENGYLLLSGVDYLILKKDDCKSGFVKVASNKPPDSQPRLLNSLYPIYACLGLA
ncbi:Ubiquinone biosynthesis O-methyltransferase [uncultured archaeon]|nr:Ubiquinone biosynthesis O-methyltransferase [uncultured archaeon]